MTQQVDARAIDLTVADGFDVSPAALSGAAGVVDANAEALADVAATLIARLDALGPCWGGDVVGARFGTAYQDAGLAVLTNIDALGTGLVRIAAALRAVAHSYELVDVASTPFPPTLPSDVPQP